MKIGVVSTKSQNVIHMPQLWGRCLNLFHPCYWVRNKEKFLEVSRTGQQFGTNWWEGKLPNAQGQHVRWTLHSGSSGTLLKLRKM